MPEFFLIKTSSISAINIILARKIRVNVLKNLSVILFYWLLNIKIIIFLSLWNGMVCYWQLHFGKETVWMRSHIHDFQNTLTCLSIENMHLNKMVLITNLTNLFFAIINGTNIKNKNNYRRHIITWHNTLILIRSFLFHMFAGHFRRTGRSRQFLMHKHLLLLEQMLESTII